MAKKMKSDGAEQSAPEDNRLRIAVLMRNFVHSFRYAPHCNEKCFKNWNAGQVIWNKNEIEQLKSLNAPIRIFVEDGSD